MPPRPLHWGQGLTLKHTNKLYLVTFSGSTAFFLQSTYSHTDGRQDRQTLLREILYEMNTKMILKYRGSSSSADFSLTRFFSEKFCSPVFIVNST